MQRRGQFVRPIVGHLFANLLIPAFTIAVLLALPAAGQVYMHPQTTTTVGGHFLAPAPSVTSVGGMHMPPPLPSVTSIPNYGYKYHNGSYSYNGGRYNRSGYAGWAYSIPYYYPVDNSAYGYDYVGAGGPDLYSGPPVGPYDPTLHIVAEQPPANPYLTRMPDPATREAQPARRLPDDSPGDPTVLVFRDGKRQEVNSYAIMGDALYVFDQGRKKIALADLDIPATTKANDERGVEFRLPPATKKKAAMTITVPPSATAPDVPSNNTASAGSSTTSLQ
jgi:hypothetical protein